MEAGGVVRTRRGHAITASVPGIEALGRIGRNLVLDGELLVEAYADRRALLEAPPLDAACLSGPRFPGTDA